MPLTASAPHPEAEVLTLPGKGPMVDGQATAVLATPQPEWVPIGVRTSQSGMGTVAMGVKGRQ